MKTLISTLTISAALLAPVAAFAATTNAPATTTAPAVTSSVAQTATTNANLAMMKQAAAKDPSIGHQANDDRHGLSRVQEQTTQLGATQ